MRLAPAFPHEQHDDHHADEAGDHGDGEDPAQRHPDLDEQEGDQRTEDGAHGVHGAVQAEGDAALIVAGAGGDERIARGAAHAFAQPVDEPPEECHRPDHGDGDDQLAEAGEPVAEGGEHAAPAGVVAPLAEGVLRDARRGFGDALDEAEHRRRRAEHAGDEDREERVDDLAAEVGEEADPAERPDVGIEAAQPRPRGRQGQRWWRPAGLARIDGSSSSTSASAHGVRLARRRALGLQRMQLRVQCPAPFSKRTTPS